MCTYVNLAAKARIKSLEIIANNHNEMLKEASGDLSVTDAVRLLVTGYHRTKRDEARRELDNVHKVPQRIVSLIHSDHQVLGFSDV